MFGLSKLATIGIGAFLVIAAVVSIWFYAVNVGEKKIENQQLKTHIEQVETARQADEKASQTIIKEFSTIHEKTVEVKEVINETPPENINPVSLARLERVWRQQQEATPGNSTASQPADVQ